MLISCVIMLNVTLYFPQLKGKRQLGKPKRIEEDNIKLGL